MTWPVATVEEARPLAGWGVDGVITERFDALTPRSREPWALDRRLRAGLDGGRRPSSRASTRGWPLLALLLHVANHVLRSLAWRNVVAAAYPDRRVPLLPIAAAYAAGVALNAVAPARGGDAAKVALVRAAIPGSSVPTIAATISVLVALRPGRRRRCSCWSSRPPGSVPVHLPSRGRGIAARWPGVARRSPARAGCRRSRHRRLRALWARLRQGGAILRTPGRYLPPGRARRRPARGAAGSASCCACWPAFGLPASVPLAAAS